ncbi:unnamed protein product, partial [Strongylus vulgaris]
MKSLAVVFMVIALTQCQSIIDCKFEYNLCGWTAESPWTIADRTFVPSPLNLSPMTLIGDGAFITAQGHFGSNSTADLISPVMAPTETHNVLSFKYTKTIGDANLQIMLKEGTNYRNLDHISTNILAFWIRRSLVVPRTGQPYQIVFRVSKLRTGFDFISIDDVMLRRSGKPVLTADEDLLSESSAVSVYQKFGSEESLIWTQSGITLAGWNRIRLPM